MAASALSVQVDIEKHGDRALPSSLDSGITAMTQTAEEQLENLRIFQELVGIRSSKEILSSDLFPAEKLHSTTNSPSVLDRHLDGFVNRPHPLQYKRFWRLKALFFTSSPENDGYYKCVIEEQWKAFVGYQISSTLITLVYLLQIFIAATITALAAFNDHRITVTVLGAINTVLAGLVAYFKGMGLPTRLRKSRNQYQHVKEFIDYKERQFLWYTKLRAKNIPIPDPALEKLNPWTAAEQVRKLYEAAQKDEQANFPDIYANDNQRAEMDKINAGHLHPHQ